MKRKNKAIIYPLVATVVSAIVAGAIYIGSPIFAYMTDTENTANTFTVGENSIVIEENFPTPATPEPNTTKTYTKSVKVTNKTDSGSTSGLVSCYVRVFLNFSDDKVRSWSTVSADGTNYYTLEEFNSHLPTGWVYMNDATLGPYYYYTVALAPGESTTELMKNFRVAYGSEAELTDYDIYVYAESVQVLDKNGQPFTGTDPWKQAWTEFLTRA